MRAILTLLSALISFPSLAQEIAGRVIDEKKESKASAVIQVYTGGILKGGTVTDYDGNYNIKPLEPGYYDVLVIYSGYDSMFTNKVLVSPDNRTSVNFALSKINGLPKITIKEYKKLLMGRNKPLRVLSNKNIDALPGNNACLNFVTNEEPNSNNRYMYFWRGGSIRDMNDLVNLLPASHQIFFEKQ